MLKDAESLEHAPVAAERLGGPDSRWPIRTARSSDSPTTSGRRWSARSTRYLQDLVASDKSFLNVLTGNYAFVNQTMASYYGIPFSGTDPNAYVQVSLPSIARAS